MSKSSERPLRGIIHFHSRYSPDSLSTFSGILAVAKRLSLDFMILTDHNSTIGSVVLERRARTAGLPLEIPIAAEYHTEYGDVIAAFIEREIVSRDFFSFVSEVREQNGLIFLPHPLVNHREVELIAAHAHLIETFNGRVGKAENEAAALLAARHKKPCYFSSDSHLTSGLTRVVLSVSRKGTLRDSLLAGEIQAETCLTTTRADVILSQVIKVIKTRDVNLLQRYCVRKAINLFRDFGKSHEKY